MDDKAKNELSKKLDPKHVKTRTQGRATLSYIEGWHAIDEANRIFGFDGWIRETVFCDYVYHEPRTIGKDQYEREGWKVTYRARVRIHVGETYRDGTGAGHGVGVDLGDAHESAMKEAETDAMKRALMTFGNPFGLALYDKQQTNVGVEKPSGVRMTKGADDVPAEQWMNNTIENMYAYIGKPRTTLQSFANADIKTRNDPIFKKIIDENMEELRDNYEIAVKDAEKKLKERLNGK